MRPRWPLMPMPRMGQVDTAAPDDLGGDPVAFRLGVGGLTVEADVTLIRNFEGPEQVPADVGIA